MIAQGGAKRNPGTRTMTPRPNGANGTNDTAGVGNNHGTGSVRPFRARIIVNAQSRGFTPGFHRLPRRGKGVACWTARSRLLPWL